MRNIMIILAALLPLFVCNKHETIFNCEGIEGQPVYMHFITENEGYLFSNKAYAGWTKITDEQIGDTNSSASALSTDVAFIFKTSDGGKSWKRIDSVSNYNYFEIADQLDGGICILRSDAREDFKFNITYLNFKKDKVENLSSTPVLSTIWSGDDRLFFTNNRGSIYLYSLGYNREIDSMKIKNYALHGLSMKNKSYAIFSGNESSYFGCADEQNKEIKLPIMPKCIIKQDDNNILIAGKSTDVGNEISLISYEVNTNKSRVVKNFENYSIVENLQSNEVAIIGFVGNIKGMFVEYDLIYSLDKGLTWQIKKLEDSYSIRPSCLVDNTVFINSGGTRMQKITLN